MNKKLILIVLLILGFSENHFYYNSELRPACIDRSDEESNNWIRVRNFSVHNEIHLDDCISNSSSKDQIEKLKKKGAVWIPDNGDGTYSNPIIFADYSDPDVIRVGDDFYMTSSSFSHFPGLPILHSKDLVNWEIISHAAIQYPIKEFNKPQHGNGIWAPSIRFHKGEFYIYYGDPDYGIFMTKSKNPEGPWTPLKLIKKAKGWIDPCPLWDDDGNAYLVHAWARSRAGIKHRLTVNKMSPDGEKILDEGVLVFCDSIKHPTMEGPKFYKRNGYYYIFAPAGGVKTGWQVVLRSKNIYGPYEDKIVLEQGSTKINGPHQGGWVETQTGESWFVHFQDRGAYGRIVHLQPIKWENDWPLMGIDYDGNGIGEPVSKFKKPDVGKIFPICVPQTSDEFDSLKLGLQWQWQANFDSSWISLSKRKGWLRFYSQIDSTKNLWNVPQLLMQKFPAEKFRVTTKLEFNLVQIGEKAGLVIFGLDYSYIGIEKIKNGFKIYQAVNINAEKNNEEIIDSKNIKQNKIYLRVDVGENARCIFYYSFDGKHFIKLGKEFNAREGKWVGAKVGIFSLAPYNSDKTGYADFDWFRFESIKK
ncbi:glycoside hydrolase 43 family protein [Ignavibacteria bacterium 4148-Me]